MSSCNPHALQPSESLRLCFKTAVPECWTVGEASAVTITLENEAGVRVRQPHSNHIWKEPGSTFVQQGMARGVPLLTALDGSGADNFRLRVENGSRSDAVKKYEEAEMNEEQGEELLLDTITGTAEGFITVLRADQRDKCLSWQCRKALRSTNNASADTTTTITALAHRPREPNDSQITPSDEGGANGDSHRIDDTVSLSLSIAFTTEWAERFNRPVLRVWSLPARVNVDRQEPARYLRSPSSMSRLSGTLAPPHSPLNVRRLCFRIDISERFTALTSSSVGCTERAPPRSSFRKTTPPAMIELDVTESASLGGYFGKVWDCSLVLASFLAADLGRSALEGKRVVELGAGCGAVSAVCAALGAMKVVATDCDDLLPLLSLNAERYCSELGLQNLKVQRYDWGSLPIFESEKPFDIVLCSDLLYDPAGWSALIESLPLLGGADCVVYLAHRLRNVHEKMFFDQLDAGREHHYRYKQLFPREENEMVRPHGRRGEGEVISDGFSSNIEGVFRRVDFPDVALYEITRISRKAMGVA